MSDSQPSDGTYVLHCGAAMGLTMNSAGAKDTARANVILYTDDKTDATYVHVWTNADGSRTLTFACTGKALDIMNNVLSHGNNVWQYDPNGSDAQKFAIAAVDGQTAELDGTSYQLYKIHPARDSSWVVEVDGTGTPASDTNLVLSEDEGTSLDQMWAFVPANPVPTGTYEIRPKVNLDLVLDVNGSSHSAGARVMISSRHVGTGVDDGRNQVAWVHEHDDNGRAKIRFVHSMLLMELAVSHNEAHQGDQVVQSYDDGGTDQQWITTPHGTATVNGALRPCYTVRNYAAQGTSLLLDVCNGGTTPGTWLQVYEQNGTAAQDFCFIPCAMPTSGLPAPSVRGIGWKEDGGDAASVLYAQDRPSGGDAYVSWTGSGTDWEVRWRAQTRAPGKSAQGWGPWRSVPDGSMANEGWGQEWRPTLVTKDGGTHTAALPLGSLVPDNKAIDWLGIQVQVRRCESDWQGSTGLFACGPGGSLDFGIAWRPSVSVTALAWTPEGILMSYKAGYARGGNTMRISSFMVGGKNIVPDGFTAYGISSEGTVTIPTGELSGIPDDGSEADIAFFWETDHGTASVAAKASIAWDASHGVSVKPEYTKTDRLTLEVSAAAHDTDEAWMMGGGKLVALSTVSREGGKVTWEAMPPIGAAYHVCIVSRSGTSWGTSTDTMPSIDDGALVWNWTTADGKRKAAIARTGRGSVPKRSEGWKPSSTSLSTTGRERPVYRFGSVSERPLDVQATVLEDEPAAWSGVEAFRELASAHHAIYRDPSGIMATVAVTGVDMPREAPGYIDVTVTQGEEAL